MQQVAVNLSQIAVPYTIVLMISIYYIVLQWRVLVKAGKHGWYCLIPFVNMWQWNTVGGVPGWLIFIPCVNGVAAIYVQYRIVRKFGFGVGMALLGILLPLIPYSCIAFNSLVEYDF